MNSHADKTRKNKIQAVANTFSQKQSGSGPTFQFVENRPEATVQRNIQEIINNSPRFQQLQAYQEMAKNSSQVKQLKAYQAMANNFTFQKAQRIERLEEETLQGKFETAQREEIEDEELLQGKFETFQQKKNNTGLPDILKSGIENLSGYAMDDVKVHYNSDKPATLQAHSYAQGTEIHLASGQEKHLPHEAWHVVQQKQGRVKPTLRMKGGVNVNDDADLEKEADLMGESISKHMKEISYLNSKENQNGIKGNPIQLKVAQLMPTPEKVKMDLGNPKKGIQFGKGRGIQKIVPHLQSEQYRIVLKNLDNFQVFAKQQVSNTKDGSIEQLKILLVIFNSIIDSCSIYEGQSDHEKASYFQILKLQAQNEKGDALGRMSDWANSVESLAPGDIKNKSVLQVIDGGRMLGGKVKLNEANYNRDVGGGTNSLNVYNIGNSEYFFKQNQTQLDVFSNADEENTALEATQGAPESVGKAFISKQNRTNLSTDSGIDVNDSRTANREVASYRLDILLGGGLISRTQFALRELGANAPLQLGSIQKGAGGFQAGNFEAQKPTLNVVDKDFVGQGAFLSRDPRLVRLLGRLQLLDTLSLQIDRNLGNYYIILDAHGNVTDLDAIDNDVSFGTSTVIDTGQNTAIYTLPGLSQYVDKDLANKILEIDIELIKLAFSDLLSQNEIMALLTRFTKLQQHLQNLKENNQLLSIEQWNHAATLMDTNSKTYQRILQQKAEMALQDRNY
jgi:hypothetical protein